MVDGFVLVLLPVESLCPGALLSWSILVSILGVFPVGMKCIRMGQRYLLWTEVSHTVMTDFKWNQSTGNGDNAVELIRVFRLLGSVSCTCFKHSGLGDCFAWVSSRYSGFLRLCKGAASLNCP